MPENRAPKMLHYVREFANWGDANDMRNSLRLMVTSRGIDAEITLKEMQLHVKMTEEEADKKVHLYDEEALSFHDYLTGESFERMLDLKDLAPPSNAAEGTRYPPPVIVPPPEQVSDRIFLKECSSLIKAKEEEELIDKTLNKARIDHRINISGVVVSVTLPERAIEQTIQLTEKQIYVEEFLRNGRHFTTRERFAKTHPNLREFAIPDMMSFDPFMERQGKYAKQEKPHQLPYRDNQFCKKCDSESDRLMLLGTLNKLIEKNKLDVRVSMGPRKTHSIYIGIPNSEIDHPVSYNGITASLKDVVNSELEMKTTRIAFVDYIGNRR